MTQSNNNTQHNRIGFWISAARLRTLPLAIAVIGMGNFLHIGHPEFRMVVFFLSIVTTVFLQVLSNFANDLGDSTHGADNPERRGPVRMVQQGSISRKAMQQAVILMAVLSLISGILLLVIAFRGKFIQSIPLFSAGLIAIAAAWFYTNGKKPYGYLALGDPVVFTFFGLLAVLGSAWLQVQTFLPGFLLPAISAGFWSVAVLNLNNMRDIKSDQKAGKTTIPILLGIHNARLYHLFLILGGIAALFLFGYTETNASVLGAIPGILLMLTTLPRLYSFEVPEMLDKLLKPQALGTFIAVMGMFIAAFLI